MNCPQCNSCNVKKNGHQNGKQRWKCKDCGRIFRESYEQKGYHPQVRKVCLKMYLNGMGFRGIERVTGIHHTTIMNWVKESSEELPEDEEGSPKVAELDELQTYIGRRSNKVWLWTAINHYHPGILAFQLGDRSGDTFEKLWKRRKYKIETLLSQITSRHFMLLKIDKNVMVFNPITDALSKI